MSRLDNPTTGGGGFSGLHADLTDVSANQHHAQAHDSAQHTLAGTAEIADVAATEAAGTNTKVPAGDHRHAHGTGYAGGHTDYPAGQPGSPGMRGDDGDDGMFVPGTPGAAGADGAPGTPGAAGQVGSPGMRGDDGDDGMFVPGARGADGANGSPGATGPQGPAVFVMGDDGDQGFMGPPGATGPAGPGGGGSTMTVVEKDFGAALTGMTSFAVSDAAVLSTSHIPCWLITEAPTGRDADEAEMEPMDVWAEDIAAGSFTLVADVRDGPVEGLYKFGYMVMA